MASISCTVFVLFRKLIHMNLFCGDEFYILTNSCVI